MSRPVNAMSYALLGLLSVQSWTGYELTQQVRHSLTHVWPASAANLYRDQQRLVRLGWADVTVEPAGPERTRNRYTITAAGRQELRDWLDGPPAPVNLASEALLRIWFADAGTPDQLARTLRATADEARGIVDRVVELLGVYLDGAGAFPERAHLNAMTGELLAEPVRPAGGPLLPARHRGRAVGVHRPHRDRRDHPGPRCSGSSVPTARGRPAAARPCRGGRTGPSPPPRRRGRAATDRSGPATSSFSAVQASNAGQRSNRPMSTAAIRRVRL